MEFHRSTAAAVTVSMALLLVSAATTEAHNITSMLEKYPDFSVFNQYLTKTHLAAEINTRKTITVLAVDNGGMSSLLSKNLPLTSLKNALSLHILLDYYGAKSIHQVSNGTVLVTSLFQTTGSAKGNTGFVNITNLKGGKVGFAPENNDGDFDSKFVKSLVENPYNISVIQISELLSSPEAEAPTPSPINRNLTSLMSSHGCKAFAEAVASSAAAAKTFNESLESGLSVFCPLDGAFKGFLPQFGNLTAEGKAALLLFHGAPVYLSIAMLKSSNGPQTTLATDGRNKYEFTVQNDGREVTLKTKAATAKITGTVVDLDPLALYTINKVLMPKELFKAAAEAPSPGPSAGPAPAPAPGGAPKKSPKKSSPPAADADGSETPSPGADDEADQAADKSDAVRVNAGGLIFAAGFSLLLRRLFLLV